MNGDASRLPRRNSHFDLLFGFDLLVDTISPLSALGQTPREFIDNHDFSISNHILSIEVEVAVNLNRALDVLVQIDESGQSNRFTTRKRSNKLSPASSELDLASVLFNREVLF